MSIKKQLLDPLGTLCKLVSLNFSELNTKISIHNHVVSLQKPYNYQFAVRLMNRDGRENVSELFYAIVRIIKWYICYEYNNESTDNCADIAKSDELKRIIVYACNGLRKLQETYDFGNVIFAIQYYINILEDAINGNHDDKKLPMHILKKDADYENLIDYNKLKNFWDYKKLKRICDLYDNCFSVYEDEINTSEKEGLIDGYLKSINTLLEITEVEFQKLLVNSNKG